MTTISIRIPGPRGLTTTDAGVHAVTAWKRLTSLLHTSWCVLNGGHYKVLHTEPDRMALRCVACGHRSPGWEVGSPRRARALPKPDSLRGRRTTVA